MNLSPYGMYPTVLSSLTAAVICSSCVGTVALRDIRADAGDWFTEAGSWARTSQTKSDGLTPPLTLAWKRQFTSGVAGSPTVTDSTVLIPFLNGELVVLKLADGKRTFRKRFGKSPLQGFTVFNSTAYWAINQDKRSFRAFDLSRGRYLWKARLGIMAAAPVVQGNKVYVGNLNRQFYCLNKYDGKIVWKHAEKAALRVSPVLGSEKVVYCDQEGNVYARSIADGRLLWRTSLSNPASGEPETPYSHPVIKNYRLLVTSLSGNVFALDARNGRFLWQINLGDPVFSSPSADSSYVFAAASSGKLYAMSQENGEVIWTYDAGTLINSEILVSDSFLLTATSKGEIICLDKTTGDSVWTDALESRIVTAPVFHNGYLIVSDDRKWVYAFASYLDGKDQN